MRPRPAKVDRHPIARLRLDEVPVLTPRARAPVFHVFEELYARAVRELAAGADRDAAESAPYHLSR
ncbi:MAG TPA: hypothetical protein VF904_02765 [Anaeromyxobacteraceae bacterium]